MKRNKFETRRVILSTVLKVIIVLNFVAMLGIIGGTEMGASLTNLLFLLPIAIVTQIECEIVIYIDNLRTQFKRRTAND